MPVTIFLADDHAIVRDGLRSLLESTAEYRIIGEAADGHTTVKRVGELNPDILIVDIAMPELNGIAVTRKLSTQCPDTKIIGLSMHADLDFVVEMLAAGARAYMVKDSAFHELDNAIQTVLKGHRYLSRQIDTVMIDEFIQRYSRQETPGSSVPLTNREKEVLQLLAEGCSNKDVSQRLGITLRSAETYRAQLMEKLNMHSIAGLTKYAIKIGLTSLEA